MNTQSCVLPSLFLADTEADTTVTVSDNEVFKGSNFSLAFFCVSVSVAVHQEVVGRLSLATLAPSSCRSRREGNLSRLPFSLPHSRGDFAKRIIWPPFQVTGKTLQA